MSERDVAAEAQEVATGLGWATAHIGGGWIRFRSVLGTFIYGQYRGYDAALLHLARQLAEARRERDAAVFARDAALLAVECKDHARQAIAADRDALRRRVEELETRPTGALLPKEE